MTDSPETFPTEFPETGMGEPAALTLFSHLISTHSAKLGACDSFAHMDPPTPEIAYRLAGMNAQYNQNMLHPVLSPLAQIAEARVIDWLCPVFGMKTGHLCAGSSLANLTALWAAREHGAQRVIASEEAHLSITKAAHILGLPITSFRPNEKGKLEAEIINQEASLERAALVLTAGTTGRGTIDDLSLCTAFKGQTTWVHVDAAWAGPLRFTAYSARLNGIEHADSVALSAHKWLFQPKDAALILFKDPAAQTSISFGGDYLARPNVGLQGSRGASAIPLLATLMAWGRQGLAHRLEMAMQQSEQLAHFITKHPEAHPLQWPETGVFLWRSPAHRTDQLIRRLGPTASQTTLDGQMWVRHVAANPDADISVIIEKITAALRASLKT